MDQTDWRLLGELQVDARLSYSELARRASLSPPAATERIRRLEERGVISGYRAMINLDRVGLPLLAFVRLKYPSGSHSPLEKMLENVSEILECHHVTGEDCFIFKVAASSMGHLEQVTGRLASLGAITTSVVYSTPLPSRPVEPRRDPDELPGRGPRRVSRHD